VVINYVSGLTRLRLARSPWPRDPVTPRVRYTALGGSLDNLDSRRQCRVRRARGDGTGRGLSPGTAPAGRRRGRSGARCGRLRSTVGRGQRPERLDPAGPETGSWSRPAARQAAVDADAIAALDQPPGQRGRPRRRSAPRSLVAAHARRLHAPHQLAAAHRLLVRRQRVDGLRCRVRGDDPRGACRRRACAATRTEELIADAAARAVQEGWVKRGDRIGIPPACRAAAGSTSLFQVQRV